MFALQRLNVVRLVDTESKRDKLLAQGYTLVLEPPEDMPEEEEPKRAGRKGKGGA